MKAAYALAFRIGLAAGLSLVGCQQRPLDVAPDMSHGSWQTIKADRNLALRVITGVSAGEMYALEATGRIFFHDGGGWSYMTETPEERAWGVRAFPSSGVYAWSTYNLYRLDSNSWTKIYESSEGMIRDIRALPSGDLHLGTTKGLLYFDGSDWTLQPGTDDFNVAELWGTSPTDIYAVGGSGRIAHYDGIEWTVLHSTNSYYFSDVWGSGAADVYASTSWEIIHFDGMEWRWITLPDGVRPIHDIWGTSGDDVYLVYGDGGIANYNGTEWEIMSSGTGIELNSIWGPAPDDIYAVGEYGKIVHFDGVEWTSRSGGRLEHPLFIWGIDDENIYVGNAEAIFHFDGTNFVELPNAKGGLEANDIWGTRPDDLTCVGKNGKVFHFDGSRWLRVDVPTTRHLHAVSGIADGSMVAAGDERTVLFWNGVTWILMYEEAGGEAFQDVWMLSRDEWFTAGKDGVIGRYANGVWDMDGVNQEEVYSLWGISSTGMFASGWEALYRFNGSVWEEMPYPERIGYYQTSNRFHSLTGTSSSNVFVMDGYIGLFHFDGNVWSPVPNGPEQSFDDIWLSQSHRLYAIEYYYADLFLYSE